MFFYFIELLLYFYDKLRVILVFVYVFLEEQLNILEMCEKNPKLEFKQRRL